MTFSLREIPAGTSPPIQHQARVNTQYNFDQIQTALGNLTVLSRTVPHDFGNIASGAVETVAVTLTGAALGDLCLMPALSVTTGGLILAAQVTAADTVTVTAYNPTGGGINPASGNLTVAVIRISS